MFQQLKLKIVLWWIKSTHLSIACGSLSVSIRVNFVKLTYNKVNSFKLVFLIESPRENEERQFSKNVNINFTRLKCGNIRLAHICKNFNEFIIIWSYFAINYPTCKTVTASVGLFMHSPIEQNTLCDYC